MIASKILAFDTSSSHCEVGLLLGNEFHGARSVVMERGQAEALMPLLEETLASCNLDWSDLDALAVGVGPGNYTGIRISVSAARGLALALGIPAVGVSILEVMALENDWESALVCMPAPRNTIYIQSFRGDVPEGPVQVIDPAGSPDPAFSGRAFAGAAAPRLAEIHGGRAIRAAPDDKAERMARIAARRLAEGHDPTARPTPLYVRAAAAAPPSDPPPVILP